jgi:hypothetical protein
MEHHVLLNDLTFKQTAHNRRERLCGSSTLLRFYVGYLGSLASATIHRVILMRRLATLLIVLSTCFIAWAGDCPFQSPISLHSDEPFDLQVFFDNTPAVATPLQLYAGDKPMRSEIADQNGRVRLGILPAGKYRVVIPHKGTLDVVVLPQRSGINGPLISWFLFPRSQYKWVAGKEVAGKPCPIVVLKAD